MTFKKTLFLWIILHPHAQRRGGTYSVGSNRKIYAYSKSLHEQCQKTTLYMHWGSGLLRGDSKETLTIVGIYTNNENQGRKKESKITSNPTKNPTHTHWCGWDVTLHSHGHKRMEAARSAHAVLRFSHTHHMVSSQTNVFIVTLVSTANIN